MAAACVALLLAATPAAAEGKAPDVHAAARARGEEGLRLFEAQRWEEAYGAFAQAEGLLHAPTLVLYMAHCRKSQGRLIEARALYEQVAGEAVPRYAPEQFKKAQATAREELEALRAVLPPGAAAATGPATVAPRGAWSPATKVAVGVAFGVGAAGLAGGAVTGALALGKIRDAHTGCAEQAAATWICPPSRQLANTAAGSSAHTLITAEATSFALGGAGAVVGAVLLIVRPGDDAHADRAALTFDVGPRWVGIQGRF